MSDAPWLAGLDGTSTWTSKPSTNTTTRPTSVTHDASDLVRRSSKSQRRSLSGNSLHTLKKARSPLAPLSMNETTRVQTNSKEEDSDGSVVHNCGTTQQRSKSSSPAKKEASLEWRKRLLHGKVAYGDQTDLFGPSGLENIFSSGGRDISRSKQRPPSWPSKTDVTMPSSPPPWPRKAATQPSHTSPASAHTHEIEETLQSEQSNSDESNPFDLDVTDSEPAHSRAASKSFAAEPETAVNRTFGALTELEQEDFSPVFISKHTTINGQIDYAAIDMEALKALRSQEVQSPSIARVPEVDVQHASDESEFTDGPDSERQASGVQDLSLSENLPTGTPEPLGRFVQVERGGYSVIGSFKHRPLSTEPFTSQASVIDTDAILPPAPTPPANASAQIQHAPSTPLKLFSAHDTFTNKRLMHRMSELDEPEAVKPQATRPRQVSFAAGVADNDSSPASDVQAPGSRMPDAFRREPSNERQSNSSTRVQSLKRLRDSQSSVAAKVEGGQQENKRPPSSPGKTSTPKRRRTLHASELIESMAPIKHQEKQEQSEAQSIHSPHRLPAPTPLQGLLNDIDDSIREATEEFLIHEDPEIVVDVLEKVEESLSDSDPVTIRQRAEAVASEVANYTLRVNKGSDESQGTRKPSVTTADFFREAECVMDYIRARAAAQKKSMLTSVAEYEQPDEDESNHSLSIPKGSARDDQHMRISREPSREDRPRSGWREPAQQQMQRGNISMNRVASQLRRWKEPDANDEQDLFLAESDPVADEIVEHSSEVVYDERAQIRITGPSSEYQYKRDEDSRPHSQRSAQSSNESTRRTENVGTLAPSAVAHLIGSEVGGMTFDKDKQRWIRTRSPEHKADNGFLNVHESHMTSEDDPFREISDLLVDEMSERRRISSPARLTQRLDVSPALNIPLAEQPTLGTRPASFHSTERHFSTSDTVLRPVETVLAQKIESRTILSDERVQEVIDSAETVIEKERDLFTAHQTGTTTSAPEPDLFGRKDEYETVQRPLYAKPSLANMSIPVLPQPTTQLSVLEQSEVSFVAPLPGDRVLSVSLSVSKPLSSSTQQPGRVLEAESSPLRNMSTMVLSDLPDFTFNDDDAVRPSEAAMTRRFTRYAAAEVNDRFASVTKELMKVLTDTHPEEVYWDSLKEIDLGQRGLTTLHGLNIYCDGVQSLNVSSNHLSQLDGIPSTVRKLSARCNELSDLTCLAHLHNLQRLDASRNQLDSLSALASCIHLRELKIDDNSITSLIDLAQSDLLTLRCRRNMIHELDFKSGHFASLTMLDVVSNHLQTVNGLEYLKRLETLKLDHNDLRTFVINAEMPSLKHLSLRDCNLGSLDVSSMPNLETLILDDNQLSSVEGLDTLSKLQVLSMRRQKLNKNTFVDVFSKRLEAHTVLLSGNVLPRLKIGVPCLSLRHLELAATGLLELPAHFGLSCSNLRTINLNSNSINDLRPLLHMEALHTLQIAGNRLSRLRKNAAVLAHLPALTSCDLRDNAITQGIYPATAHTFSDQLVRVNTGVDVDEDVTAAQTEQQRYGSASANSTVYAEHVLRLDEETNIRRRVYEMMLAHSCKQLKLLDGLAFDKVTAARKDQVWDKLLALGVVRKSDGVTA